MLVGGVLFKRCLTGVSRKRHVATRKPNYTEHKLLPFSPIQIFNVVASIEHYKEFVPYCTDAVVVSRTPKKLIADLTLGLKKNLPDWTYRSVVYLEEPHNIKISSIETNEKGLLKFLNAEWKLQEGPTIFSCKVNFEVYFEFSSPVHALLLDKIFTQIQKQVVQAFENRCHKLYNNNNNSINGIL